MNAYDYFNYLPEFAAALGVKCQKKNLEDVDYISIFKSAKKSLFICSGEMRSFDKHASELLEIIDSKPEIKIEAVCGKCIYTGVSPTQENPSPLNRLVEGLCERAEKGKNIQIQFNETHITEQVMLGYIHCIVVDGQTSFVECPHGSPKREQAYENRPWYEVQDSERFAKELKDNWEAYKFIAGLDEHSLQETKMLISQNTKYEDDFYRETEGLSFHNLASMWSLRERLLAQ